MQPLVTIIKLWRESNTWNRVFIAFALLVYAVIFVVLGFVIDKGMWRIYQTKYAEAIIDRDEARIEATEASARFAATMSAVALFPATLPTGSPSESQSSATPTAQPQAPISSPNPELATTLFLSPAALIKGTCPDRSLPCLYNAALSWNEIAVWLYGDAERCRWVEIADLNRRPDGHYLLPLQQGIDVFVPSVGSRGSFRSMTRDDAGNFTYIPDCSTTSGKPCLFTIPEGIFGANPEAYKRVAAISYSQGTSLNAQRIMDANLAGDCSKNPFTLAPGTTIVIPK